MRRGVAEKGKGTYEQEHEGETEEHGYQK